MTRDLCQQFVGFSMAMDASGEAQVEKLGAATRNYERSMTAIGQLDEIMDDLIPGY